MAKNNRTPAVASKLLRGIRLTLTDGREIEVPRWSARTAIEIGRRLAAAAAPDSDGQVSSAPINFLPLVGEIVCLTLCEPSKFLDTLTKEDLIEIAGAIYEQEFKTKEFEGCLKKAAALLPASKPLG